MSTGKSAVVGDSVVIDNVITNGSPTANVFAMHANTLSVSNWNHPIATYYDATTSKWRIRNEDSAAMPTTLSFVVHVEQDATRVYTHPSAVRNYIIIDDPKTNYNPYATVVVTPFSGGHRRMNHPYAVAYVHPFWEIVFSDGASMPLSSGGTNLAGFFVKTVGFSHFQDDSLTIDPSGFQPTGLSNGAGIDIFGNGASRVSGSEKFFRNFCWQSNVSIPPLVTLNWTPLPPFAPINYNFIEAKFFGSRIASTWGSAFHEDGSTMAAGTPLNVWGPYATGCAPYGPF